MKTCYLPVLLVLLALPGTLPAQQAASRCPALPSGSGLQWEEKASPGFIACKARGADGRQSLNVLLTSRDPDMRMSRSRRQESGVFSGESLHWYVPEIAGQNDAVSASRRIAVVKLGKDQYAQVWIDAASPDDLAHLQTLAGQLDVSAGTAYLVSGN